MLSPTGYFDEAGIHSQSAVIVVAGSVAPKRDWRRLEIKWQKVLKEEGADCYHTTDIEADPPRGIYKGWTRAKADHLTDRLVPIAAEYAGRVYGVHIMASAWYVAVPFVKTYLPDRPHDGPYLLLAQRCIEAVIDSQDNDFSEQIAFVFAENDFTHQLVAGFRIMKTVNPRPSLMGPLGLDSPADNAMLQASDMISWHYRCATEIRHAIRNAPIHRATPLLIKKDSVFRYVPEDAFRAQVARLFEVHGTEWSQVVLAKLVKQEQKRQEREQRGEERRRDRSK